MLKNFEAHQSFLAYSRRHFVGLDLHDGMFVEFETRLCSDPYENLTVLLTKLLHSG